MNKNSNYTPQSNESTRAIVPRELIETTIGTMPTEMPFWVDLMSGSHDDFDWREGPDSRIFTRETGELCAYKYSVVELDETRPCSIRNHVGIMAVDSTLEQGRLYLADLRFVDLGELEQVDYSKVPDDTEEMMDLNRELESLATFDGLIINKLRPLEQVYGQGSLPSLNLRRVICSQYEFVGDVSLRSLADRLANKSNQIAKKELRLEERAEQAAKYKSNKHAANDNRSSGDGGDKDDGGNKGGKKPVYSI